MALIPRAVLAILAGAGILWAAGGVHKATAQTAPQTTQPTGGQEDLAEKLMRKATGAQETGIMAEIRQLMEQSRSRLGQDFDPGEQTQAVQQEIVRKLDEALAAARKKHGGRSTTTVMPKGDKRSKQEQDAQRQEQNARNAAPGDPTEGPPASVEPVQPDRSGRVFREHRRGWGHLPPRDRDEVLQGMDEEVIERYRDAAEGYFKKLADETEEER